MEMLIRNVTDFSLKFDKCLIDHLHCGFWPKINDVGNKEIKILKSCIVTIHTV